MNLWDKLSALVADDDVAKPVAKAAPAAPLPEARQAAFNSLEELMRMLPQTQSLRTLSPGQVQLLDLESMRAHLGDRWHRVEHQVHALVEATLRQLLSSTDVFVQVGDSQYLVVLPRLKEKEASALMFSAAAQIRAKLFGQDRSLNAAGLQAKVTKVSWDAAGDLSLAPSNDAKSGGAAGSRAAASANAAMQAQQSESPARHVTTSFNGLDVSYQPIWTVKQQAVASYRMQFAITIGKDVMSVSEFCATYDDPGIFDTVNAQMTHRVIDELFRRHGDTNRVMLIVQLGRRLIDDERGLRLVLDQLSRLSDQDRQFLTLEIVDAYLGDWPTLAPRIALIKRACRNVCVRLSLDHKDFQTVAATGATMVSGDLADHDWPERQILGALNAFAAASSQCGLKSLICGLATNSMVIAALGAGLDQLAGPPIGADGPQPRGVYPLSVEGFYLLRQAQRQQVRHDPP